LWSRWLTSGRDTTLQCSNVFDYQKGLKMKLDAHKSAVAKAYGLASAGYNKPPLKFFSQGAESLVDFAGLSPGQTILDVASGTGHAAFYAGTKVGAAQGSVVGIDLAEEMVNLANAYADTLHGCNVHFTWMDGEQTGSVDNELTRFFVLMASFSSRKWPMGSKSGNGYRKTAAGCVCRPLAKRHSNHSRICLKIAFDNSALSSPTKNALLAGNGWSTKTL
jgi:SAM-dependent methyltransferase